MTTYEEYLTHIQSEQFDARTEPGKAVYYSGSLPESKRRNWDLAETFCADTNFSKIENTNGGRWLKTIEDEDKNLSNSQISTLWSAASKRYAEQAIGDITAFIHGAQEERVFYSVELPALLKNENVTSINSISRSEMLHWYNSQESPVLGLEEVFKEISHPSQIEETVMAVYERKPLTPEPLTQPSSPGLMERSSSATKAPLTRSNIEHEIEQDREPYTR